MKRFRFSLQTLLNVKESLKKQRQAELAAAKTYAEQCRSALEQSKRHLRERMREMAEKTAGMDVEEMKVYAKHFVFVRDRIEQQKEVLSEAMEEVRRRQQAVIEMMQEVKILEKLREKQYLAYLEEVKVEQEKEIGDFVSFMVGSAETASEGER